MKIIRTYIRLISTLIHEELCLEMLLFVTLSASSFLVVKLTSTAHIVCLSLKVYVTCFLYVLFRFYATFPGQRGDQMFI